MKILIIEDEKKTADYLQRGLREHGYNVDLAINGEDGLHLIRNSTYNLAILDVMLPDRDGWSVLEEIRRSKMDVPVLMLTARDAVQDRVKGLELGADDYLIKPFAFSELLARIKNILRRPVVRPQALEGFKVADLSVDFLRRKAYRQSRELELTPKEFMLLTLLARKTGEVLSRTLIAEEVWDMHFESDTNFVDVHVRRLRAKIDDPFEKKLIHTVRGFGYVLENRA